MSQEELEQIQGQRNEYGERLQKNSKDSAKFHTNWLNMMYPRLQLAKDLLTDDGVIFISIDDNEIDNLKILCDEVFGNNNFMAQIMPIANPGGRDYKQVAITLEYLLVYAKSDELILNEITKDVKFEFKDNIGGYEPRDLRNRNPKFNSGNRPNLFYPFYVNTNNKDEYGYCEVSLEHNDNYVKILPLNSEGKESVWRWGKIKAQQNITNNSPADSQIIAKLKNDGSYTICEKCRKITTKVKSVWDETEMRTENGTRELRTLMGGSYFDHPKSLSLINRCCEIGAAEDAIILDFFSGSATTAHACMQLNSEDNGNRKFILVQLPEATDEGSEARKAGFENICEIGKERIRRAGQKIKEEIEQGNQQLKLGEEPKQIPDIGFKVFRVGETTLNWEKLRLQGKDIYHDYLAGTSEKDKLDFTPDFQNDLNVVYEIMLRQEGLPLTSNIEKLTDIGSRTYLVKNSYLISLEETITQEMIEKLSALNPLPFKFVFRDSAFDDDIVFKDETFRRLNALIDKNTSNEKKTYTVEFI